MNAKEALREQPPEVLNAVASGWMKRGIALLTENTTASLTQSLRWFDRAIALRRRLPLPENAWYRYVLAAGWMNRADALTRLGSADQLAKAVRSYDEALALLLTLDFASDSLFRKRLTLAWMNRGITLQEQGTAESLRAALASFDEAIALLRESTEHRLILATALTNRGNAFLCLAPPSPSLALESATEALALIVGFEEQDVVAAETGFKARHILCRAIASQLTAREGESAREDLIAAATDAVEDGLKLARHWATRGGGSFRNLAGELFRFGVRIYQIYQPHFLTEFLLENLDPAKSSHAFPIDPELQFVAGEAIAHAFGDLQRDSFSALHTPRYVQLMERFRQLRVAEARLSELSCARELAPETTA